MNVRRPIPSWPWEGLGYCHGENRSEAVTWVCDGALVGDPDRGCRS